MESLGIGNKYVGMDTSMLMEMAHSKHASKLKRMQQLAAIRISVSKAIFKGSFETHV